MIYLHKVFMNSMSFKFKYDCGDKIIILVLGWFPCSIPSETGQYFQNKPEKCFGSK